MFSGVNTPFNNHIISVVLVGCYWGTIELFGKGVVEDVGKGVVEDVGKGVF